MEKKRLKEAKNVFIKRSFVLGIIAILVYWFMKIIGFNIFGLDLNNKFFNDLDKLMANNEWLKQIYYSCTLYLQMYFIYCIIHKEDGKKSALYILCCMPIFLITRILTSKGQILYEYSMYIESIVALVLLCKFKYKKIIPTIIVIILNIFYQKISTETRDLNFKGHGEFGFVAEQILCIDYYLLLYLSKEVCKMDGGTFFFFGLTSWLYAVAGFIVGLFTLHPIKKAKEYYSKGKAKEDARKTKKKSTKTAKAK